MKYVKMLALSAIAVAAVMAFVGASSASATVLCATEPTEGTNPETKTKGTTCPEGWAYSAGTTIHAVNEGNVTLTDANGNTVVTCKESTVEGKTENEGSATETVKGPVEKLTWNQCTGQVGEACEVKTVKGGSLEVHWVADTFNGTLTSSGAEITTLCKTLFGNVHCIYITNATDLQTLTGGNPATLDVETQKIPQVTTDGLCPGEAKWDAKYEVTTPKPLYVAAHT